MENDKKQAVENEQENRTLTEEDLENVSAAGEAFKVEKLKQEPIEITGLVTPIGDMGDK